MKRDFIDITEYLRLVIYNEKIFYLLHCFVSQEHGTIISIGSGEIRGKNWK